MSWVSAFIFALLCCVAAAFVLLPLLRPRARIGRSADETNVAIHERRLAELHADLESGAIERAAFDEARAELDHDLLGDLRDSGEARPDRPAGRRGAGMILGAATVIPLVAVGLYFWLGDPQAATREAGAPPQSQSIQATRARVDTLRQRVAAEPKNAAAWRELGEAYLVLDEPMAAARAFEDGMDASGESAELLTARARALAMAADGRLAGEPRQLLKRALQRNDRYPGALWFAGLAAEQAQETDRARDLWQKLLAGFPADSDAAGRIRRAIRDLGGPGDAAAAGSGGRVEVSVTVTPQLVNAYPPESTVFVLARAVDGPTMPLAVRKLQLGELPATVTLDDSAAMSPELRLSRFNRVTLVARVSPSGQAMPQPGDLEGESGPVSVKGGTVARVVVDHRL